MKTKKATIQRGVSIPSWAELPNDTLIDEYIGWEPHSVHIEVLEHGVRLAGDAVVLYKNNARGGVRILGHHTLRSRTLVLGQDSALLMARLVRGDAFVALRMLVDAYNTASPLLTDIIEQFVADKRKRNA